MSPRGRFRMSLDRGFIDTRWNVPSTAVSMSIAARPRARGKSERDWLTGLSSPLMLLGRRQADPVPRCDSFLRIADRRRRRWSWRLRAMTAGAADRAIPRAPASPRSAITKKDSPTAAPSTSPSCGRKPLHRPGRSKRRQRHAGHDEDDQLDPPNSLWATAGRS
jgi:hypothetical protein